MLAESLSFLAMPVTLPVAAPRDNGEAARMFRPGARLANPGRPTHLHLQPTDRSIEWRPSPKPPTTHPPAVWQWTKPSGGKFAIINRPIAGATHDRELPVGEHPLQLYALGTPNGVKVTIMLEELLAAGHAGAEYDAWLIDIGEGDQFGRGFVALNPNRKIPALLDRTDPAQPAARVRKRRDPALPRREVRRLPADRPRRPHRGARAG